MHVHDLRHNHATWLIEDGVPRVLRLKRIGHKPKDTADHYSHVTRPMIDAMLASLEARWDNFGTWTWAEHFGNADEVTTTCSQSAPTTHERPADDDHRQAA